MQLSKIFNHKFLLNCCNLAFLICGAGLIFFGFYIFTDTRKILLSRLLAATSEKLNDLPHPLFFYIAMCLAVAGTIQVFAAIIGFWASCLNTYCFLTIYFIIIIVLLLAESAACLAIALWPQCLGLSLDDTKMVKALQGFYGVPGREQFTIAMDLAQTHFNCCGMNSENNYETSMWRLQGFGQKDWPVPVSCCMLNNKMDRFNYLDPKPSNQSQCESLLKSDFEKARHTEPCLDYLELWYRQEYVVFLVTGLIIAIVEFCVLLSIVFSCTKISRKKKIKKLLRSNKISVCSVGGENGGFIVENIYEPDFGGGATGNDNGFVGPSSIQTIAGATEEMKEIYIQPPDLYKSKHNMTFKPSNRYHISRSYLV